MSAELPADVALELAHALVQSLADDESLEVLFVKGIVANHHALRPARVSSDVDVWLHAEDRDALIAALERRGWYRRPESFAHQAFVSHSLTLMHDRWPCDIDVHVRFPGLFDREAFSRLYRRRIGIDAAGARLDAVDFCGAFVIGVVHALRQTYLAGSARELDHLERIWREELDDPRRQEIVELTAELGGTEPMRPFFQHVGVAAPVQPGYAREIAEWRIQTKQLNRTSLWLAFIAEQPLHRRPGIVLRAIFPSRKDLQIDHPEAGTGVRSELAAWGSRIARAGRSFVRSWSTWRQVRRDIRHDGAASSRPLPEPHTSQVKSSEEGGAVPTAARRRGEAVASRVLPHPAIEVAEGVLSSWRDERVYVLATGASGACSPLCLEGTGVAIWQELSVHRGDLVERVAGRYGVSSESIAADVDDFIAQLARRQLVVTANA